MNHKKHGYGVYSWPDGRVYEGTFKEGQFHGEARFTSAKGKMRIGLWNNGKLEKI